MVILSHRGYWKHASEKNTEIAFRRSFELGLGTETDFRDAGGTLVISHDPPGKADAPMTAERFFEIFISYNRSLPLALNIKSDGLYPMVQSLLLKFQISSYFVFDMSVPDALGYLKHGIRAFTRQSEYERTPAFYDRAAGVWIDAFESDWLDDATVFGHLAAGKQVCIVSPELHQRPHEAVWRKLGAMKCTRQPGVMLCTDFPQEARKVLG